MNDALFMTFIRALPRKHVARSMGALASWRGSPAAARTLAGWFARTYQLNMDEAEHPLETYPDLLSLFTRRLKPDVRRIDPDPLVVVSPVDGVMSESGVIDGDTCTQIKGRTYSVDTLLGGPEHGKAFHGGHFVTIYLSPRHYHRIHSPLAGQVVRWHHAPGELFPVNAAAVRSVDGLFAINERLTSFVRLPGSSRSEVAVVKVGAIGVGRIRLSYDDFATNAPGQLPQWVTLDPPRDISKGGELGVFELGSTVVLLFPKNLVTLLPIEAGTELVLGQRIALLNTP